MTVQEIIDLFSENNALAEAERILNEIKYGTAGYRAEFGPRFNYLHILVNAQAIAEVAKERFAQAKKEGKLEEREKAKIFIGYDTRFMSKEFAEIIAAVLAANGVEVEMSDVDTPTPAISWLLGASNGEKYDLAVNMTASHNSAEYNGIKVNEPFGGQAGSDITEAIQGKINEIAEGKIKVRYETLEKGRNDGNVEMKRNLKEEYVAAYVEMFKRQFNIKTERDFNNFINKAKNF
jgi:phosphomannomutase